MGVRIFQSQREQQILLRGGRRNQKRSPIGMQIQTIGKRTMIYVKYKLNNKWIIKWIGKENSFTALSPIGPFILEVEDGSRWGTNIYTANRKEAKMFTEQEAKSIVMRWNDNINDIC